MFKFKLSWMHYLRSKIKENRHLSQKKEENVPNCISSDIKHQLTRLGTEE